MSTSGVEVASVQIPGALDAPVTLDFFASALRMAVVRRDGVSVLSPEWQKPGVYILIGEIADGHRLLYVGKTKHLRHRVLQHRDKKPWWTRALMVQRDTRDGFHSADVGYLEGRLARELDERDGIQLETDRRDSDETLPAHMRIHLDGFVGTILSALRLIGVDFLDSDTGETEDHEADENDDAEGTGWRAQGRMPELIASGALPVGATLTFSRKVGGEQREASATVTASGELIHNGRAYSSPSTAATVALGLKSTNGWRAWRLGGPKGPTLKELLERLDEGEGT